MSLPILTCDLIKQVNNESVHYLSQTNWQGDIRATELPYYSKKVLYYMEYLPSPVPSWIWLALFFKLCWLLEVEGGRFLWGLFCLLDLDICSESGALWPDEAVGGVQTGGALLDPVSGGEGSSRGLGVSEIDKKKNLLATCHFHHDDLLS